MDGSNEFVIPVLKGREIRQEQHFIGACFGVRVDFTGNSPRTAAKNEWVKITGPEQARKKAEVFIKGIANPECTHVYSIPNEIAATGSWLQELIFYVQQSCLAVVKFMNKTHLLLQGSQIAVGQAFSLLESYITNARQRMPQNTGLAYQSQNQTYHPQPVLTYYGPRHGHYDSPNDCNTVRNQDIVFKGTQPMPEPCLQNPGQHEQVIFKGIVLPGCHEKQSEFATQYQGRPKMNESLRDYAQKLDYTDEEIKSAMAKFAASGTNQDPDENSLLQHLIQLFPQKQPSFRTGSESTVVRDSSSHSVSSHINTDAKQVSSEERDQPKFDGSSNQELRHIVVDGSNVAMSHGNRDVFSCKGIKLCVDYFKQRGHDDITVFVPRWRKEASKPDRPIEDQQILYELEKEQILSFTPLRCANGKRVICYNAQCIVKLAAENDGIVVSNGNFRDLVIENPEWKKVIEERLLIYTFVKDVFMPPDDPLGRHGPKLEAFLRKGTQTSPRLCPYMKKCTYGNKCRYYHPEKNLNSKEEAKNLPDFSGKPPSASVAAKFPHSVQRVTVNQEGSRQKEILQGSPTKSSSAIEQANTKPESNANQTPLQSDASSLQATLEKVLPTRSEDIRRVIMANPNEKDLDTLCDMVLRS